jgi:hypothetical protein
MQARLVRIIDFYWSARLNDLLKFCHKQQDFIELDYCVGGEDQWP